MTRRTQVFPDANAYREMAEALHDAISRLTTHQQNVILRYARGRSYEQVAEDLGISRTATNKAIDVAKRNLRINGILERAVRNWVA